ncbi:ATP-binding protein [Deinococcus sonorensis]|uniref:histidine kinase n=2 Tax=Deinococcus sonorensis TaxID=309891 RepID=A0AAU7UDA0_9DEIO
MAGLVTDSALHLMGQLQEITAQLAGVRTPQQVYDALLQRACGVLEASAGVIWVASGSGWTAQAQVGQLPVTLPALLEPDGLMTRALEQERPQFSEQTGHGAGVVLPLRRDGQPEAALVLWYSGPRSFPAHEQQFLSILALQSGIALGRVRSVSGLERRVAERTAAVIQQSEALDAFVRFTEVSVETADVLTLAQLAMDLLRSVLVDVSTVYYQLEDGVWKARLLSSDISPEVEALTRAGISPASPSFAAAVRAGGPYFQDRWSPDQEGLSAASMYAATARAPYFLGGAPHGLLAMSKRAVERWTQRERAVFRAVAKSLGLAFERAQAQREAEQRARQAEEAARAQSAFVAFTEMVGLRTDRHALFQAVFGVLGQHLPGLGAVAIEPEGERWVPRVWTDNLAPPLVRVLQAGLPLDPERLSQLQAHPEPLFMDREAWRQRRNMLPALDTFDLMAAYPLVLNGRVHSLLAFGLPSQAEAWSNADRALILAVGRGLTLAMERAMQAQELEAQRSVLQARTQALQDANEELEAFSYSVSHDLRTPVRHIKGFTELLQRDIAASGSEKALRYVGIIDQATNRMTALIDAMLNLSRTSRQELRIGPVPLPALVEQARRDTQPEVQEGRQIEWVIGALPTVLADHDTLQQVMTNLISNALKYTRTRPLTRIEVWAEETPTEWQVHVRDNGVGFEPKYSDKLFGVFQRLHRQEEFEGTGVGLANVRRIIVRQGGRVWATGVPQEGATFSFSLPRVPAQA